MDEGEVKPCDWSQETKVQETLHTCPTRLPTQKHCTGAASGDGRCLIGLARHPRPRKCHTRRGARGGYLGPMGLRYAPSLRGRSCSAKAVPGEDTANTPSNKDAVRLQSPSQTRVNKEGSVRDLHSSRRQEPTSHNQSHQSPYGLSKSLRGGPQGCPMQKVVLNHDNGSMTNSFISQTVLKGRWDEG